MSVTGIKCPVMDAFSQQDRYHIEAAEGWMLLDANDEAEKEWLELSSSARNSLEGLKIRYWILSSRHEWEAAEDCAQAAIAEDHRDAQLWIWLAYASRRKSGSSKADSIRSAWKILIEAVKSGVKDPIIFFNLACYACLMGSLEEARQWFKKSCFMANSVSEMQKMALEEEDLKPLWKEIRDQLLDEAEGDAAGKG